ncbi:MAG: filamentous hemagglutinin N-terminal domain-containing protein [Cyanobacteria bacterium P01_A01_bin.17]
MCSICHRIGIGGSVLLALPLFACPSKAQIVPDGTLPATVNAIGSSVEITGGVQRGSNLFHSFESFSVRGGEIADFRIPNSGTVENIINRVTGSSVSHIDGTLQAGGSANIFLINPNGIIFGPNATLNIGGSFLGATASGLTFADGTVFSTKSSQTSLLTMSTPTGLQFGVAPGSIVNQSNAMPNGRVSALGDPVGLQVRPNNTLALVGGEVMFEGGHLDAPSGRIEIGAVGDHSFVGLASADQGFVLDYAQVDNFQDIHIGALEPAFVPSSFTGIDVSSINTSGAGGTVMLRGQNISVRDGSQIISVINGTENGGSLGVFATESIVIEGALSGLFSQVGTLLDSPNKLTGDGGEIRVETQQFFLRNGGQVSSGTFTDGQAGDVTIVAAELVEVTGLGKLFPIPSAFDIGSTGTGAGGTLNIETGLLTLDQGFLSAQTLMSDGGNINLQVSDLLLLRNNSQITARAGGAGDGGNVEINAGLIFALPNQDSNIVASASEGKGGDITINTQGLFGLAERQAVLSNGTNDIDASSEFGLAGGIEIDTLVSDPDSALVNLPEGVSDPSQKIAIGCAAKQGNSFVLAGRGGVPSSPQDLVSNPQLWNDVRDLSAFRTTQQRGYPSQEYAATRPVTPAPLLEATGWHRDAQGRMRLVNHQPNLTSADLGDAAQTC